MFVVSTPIGNLGDMTHRAIDVLGSVHLVVAEDTRHSRTLLDHYDIRTPTSAYHEHNEARESPRLVARMRDGESIAIITDAGTPLVSDPGDRLVRAAIDAGVRVIPIPGASALLSALVVAGFATDRFAFYGFLDRKGRDRGRTIAELLRSPITAVVYESPNRVGTTLAELAAGGAGDRRAVVARELTKKFETVARGTVAELAEQFAEDVRGEIVIVLDGAAPVELDDDAIRARVASLRANGLTPRDIVDRLTSELGVARNLAYRLSHE